MKAVRLVTVVALVILSVLGLGAAALAADEAAQPLSQEGLAAVAALPEAEIAADMVMLCEIDGSCGFIAAALLEPLAEVESVSIEPEAAVASVTETLDLAFLDGLMCEPADGSCIPMPEGALDFLALVPLSVEPVATVAGTTEIELAVVPEGLMCEPLDGSCIPISESALGFEGTEVILEGEGTVAAVEQPEVTQPEAVFEPAFSDAELDPFAY